MEIKVLGNYKKSGYSSGRIIDKNGIAPTFTENHGSVLVITVNDEGLSYDEIKKQINVFIKNWRLKNGREKTKNKKVNTARMHKAHGI